MHTRYKLIRFFAVEQSGRARITINGELLYIYICISGVALSCFRIRQMTLAILTLLGSICILLNQRCNRHWADSDAREFHEKKKIKMHKKKVHQDVIMQI